MIPAYQANIARLPPKTTARKTKNFLFDLIVLTKEAGIQTMLATSEDLIKSYFFYYNFGSLTK